MKNLNTILPFYDALTEQYRYREDSDVDPCLTVTDTGMIPFCIRRTHNDGTKANITIYVKDLTGTIKETLTGNSYLTITTGTAFDHILFSTGTSISPALSTGSRYLHIHDEGATTHKDWYSETFIVQNSVTTFLKFEFSNATELSNIPAAFLQIVYLNSTLKTPEYLREDTGDKRDGLIVKEKQVWMKSYTMRSILATEYLVDALMLTPMMDYNWVTTQSGEVMSFDEIRVKDPEWNAEAKGSRAKIELQLIKDVVVKKLSFKETGYGTGGVMSATIKQGMGTTSYASPNYTYQVTFDTPLEDDQYTPAAYTSDTGALGEVQIPMCSSILSTGFLITTTTACTVRWSAIHV
jgi:hypothetical protein